MSEQADSAASEALAKAAFRHTLTPEQEKRAHDAFMRALNTSVVAYDVGQLGLFHEDDETYIRREVERMLYKQKLPNGGDKERRMIERLKEFGNSMAPEWQHHARLHYAIKQWNLVLPATKGAYVAGTFIPNSGRYYIRKPLTPKLDKVFFDEMTTLKDLGHKSKDWAKKWFAQMMLDGLPEAVSDFSMECLFILRKLDGSVTRLVRLRNIVGETTRGEHQDGAVMLEERAFAAPEKFREWVCKCGNYNWTGDQRDLNLLREDINRLSAHNVINRVDYPGQVKLINPTAALLQSANKKPAPTGPGPSARSRWELANIMEMMGDCCYYEGKPVLKSDHGVYKIAGAGYYLSPRGRETPFSQGLPMMRPGWNLVRRDNGTYDVARGVAEDLPLLAQFYSDVCDHFHDALASYEGYLGMGAMFSYSAGAELWEQYAIRPGTFVHGQMGSGKSKVGEWFMRIRGFKVTEGISLMQGTPVGLLCENENYSNEPVWVNEYYQNQIDQAKDAILQDAYNGGISPKWLPPDAIQRTMRTSFIVSGESTAARAALRSRYCHIQVSAAKRKELLGDQDRTNLEWMEASKGALFILGRFLHEHRADFVGLVQDYLEEWLASPAVQSLNERERMVHGIDLASWQAMTALITAKAKVEPACAQHAIDFYNFTIEHAKISAEDVTSETNINVFIQALLTTFRSEDGIPLGCFRLETELLDHHKAWPNQRQYVNDDGQACNGHKSHTLYIAQNDVIDRINIYLRRSGGSLALRQKDLQAQLSKMPFWKPGNPKKCFDGSRISTRCWGFEIDKMEMGYQECSDEALQRYLSNPKDGSDPRKGPFYEIVEALEKAAANFKKSIE